MFPQPCMPPVPTYPGFNHTVLCSKIIHLLQQTKLFTADSCVYVPAFDFPFHGSNRLTRCLLNLAACETWSQSDAVTQPALLSQHLHLLLHR